jgi:hypothetical protein
MGGTLVILIETTSEVVSARRINMPSTLSIAPLDEPSILAVLRQVGKTLAKQLRPKNF